MRNKKGFTLIELLAVIVILAVIALITVPVVINIINNAKKGAAEDSAYGVIEAAKLYWVENSLEDTNNVVTFTYDGENSKWITVGDKELLISGTKPTGTNESSIVISSGNVSLNNVKFNGFTCNTNNEYKVECTLGSGSNQGNNQGGNTTPQVTYKPRLITESGATHKGIVYLNPTNLEVECDENNSQIGTGEANQSGCMKFYVYDDSGDTYKMILDHNTTPRIAYNSTMEEALSTLSSDTTGWVGLPRLINKNEIMTLTNTLTYDGWFYLDGTGNNKQTKVSTSQGESIYAWLFDYTRNCISSGCNIEDLSTDGYWIDGNSVAAYYKISNSGTYGYCTGDCKMGIRPVITLSKSQIQA